MCITYFGEYVWWYTLFSYCQQMPWKDQNQQWIDPTNKCCLCSESLMQPIPPIPQTFIVVQKLLKTYKWAPIIVGFLSDFCSNAPWFISYLIQWITPKTFLSGYFIHELFLTQYSRERTLYNIYQYQNIKSDLPEVTSRYQHNATCNRPWNMM